MKLGTKSFTIYTVFFSILILSCRLVQTVTPVVPPTSTVMPISSNTDTPQPLNTSQSMNLYAPTALPALAGLSTPQIILQRLEVSFLGQDGHKLVGSGCPGNYGKGTIVDYHFSVSGVDTDRQVKRIVVTGDNSTLTWATPCSDNWDLAAIDLGGGKWDILIAPSEYSRVYTILFFYNDNSVALGMTVAPSR